MSFSTLGLSGALLRAVADQGYSTPTPIQSKAIPAILAGRDVLAAARTGTGKTAAFVLPVLHRLAAATPPPARGGRRRLRALVLVPTRELAAQVDESVRAYGRHLALASTVVIGGAGLGPQAAALRRGVDVLVATPGRLLDHLGQRNVDLSGVETFVLDEADRMLDMGFIRDIRRVIALLPAKRQNLLFSATFSPEIKELAHTLLDRPQTIEVDPTNTAVDAIDQVVHRVERGRKRAVLSTLIGRNDWRQVLVFTRTKHGADRLTDELLGDGIDALAIHGNKSQGQRTRALARFKAGTVRVLVATDIAARGLDIDQLPHVVNFDLPDVPEDYVHRVGRTGRAGASGQAISLVSGEERGNLRDIERLIRKSIRTEAIEGFECGWTAATPPSPAGFASKRRTPAARGASAPPASQRPRGRNGPSTRTGPSTQARRRGRDGKPSSTAR